MNNQQWLQKALDEARPYLTQDFVSPADEYLEEVVGKDRRINYEGNKRSISLNELNRRREERS